VIRTLILRLRPNKTQIAQFEYILDYNCETYNAALQERIEAWELQRKSIGYYDQCKEISELRREDPQHRIISVVIQRDPLDRLDKSYNDYFRRCKEGKKPGHPRFRSRSRYKSFAFGYGGNPLRIKLNKILIPNIGYIKFKTSQQLIGKYKQATVKQVGKNWIILLTCDIGEAPERQPVSNPIGIDLGVTKLITLSDGSFIENPKWESRHAQRVAKIQRKLARCKRRSKNRIKTKELLRRAYQKVTNTRRNFLHHTSKKLVSTYDFIAFEKLPINNMTRNRRFGKAIKDASWKQLILQITYKAEYAGKWAVPVDPRNTTKKCSQCGIEVKKEIGEHQHNCSCGLSLDRDHNAAINILAFGRSVVVVQAK
jgi:putative transposase